MVQKKILSLVLTLVVVGSAMGQVSPTGSDIGKMACKDITPAQNFTLDLPLFAAAAVYTVPLASLSNVRVYAATFLGRLANDQAEVDKMCMNILFDGLVAVQTGYVNRTYINLATPTQVERGAGIFDFSTQLAHSTGVNTSYQATSIETIPLSDGKDWAMFVRCINNDFMDWKVASRRPLTSDEKANVLAKAAELGFDTTTYYDRENSSFACPTAPTVPEAAVQTLINFKVFSNDSPLLQNLAQPLQVLGKRYNNLLSLLNSLILTPVGTWANLLIQKCTSLPTLLTQLPLACILLAGNNN